MQPLPVWVRLLLNKDVSQEEIDRIPRPKLEYTRYMTFKSAEIGGLIGCMIGGLTTVWGRQYTEGVSKTFRDKALIRRIDLMGRKFLVGGLIIGPIISSFKIHGQRMSEIYRMCHNLRQDECTNRRDRWAVMGGTTGAFMGAVSNHMLGSRYTASFVGVVGMSLGLLLAMTYSLVLPPIDTKIENVTGDDLEEEEEF